MNLTHVFYLSLQKNNIKSNMQQCLVHLLAQHGFINSRRYILPVL